MPCSTFDERRDWTYCWLLDPLDGTRGFIDGSLHFSINVALVYKQQAVLGALYDPVHGSFYYGAQGRGAFCRPRAATGEYALRGRTFDPSQVTVVLGEERLRGRGTWQQLAQQRDWNLLGINSALKLAFMADGHGDFYPRSGMIYEWDIAAGQCILEQVGGAVLDMHGQPLRYNTGDALQLPTFVAMSDAASAPEILNIVKEVYKDVD